MDLTDKSLKLTEKRIEALHSLGIYDTEGLLRYYPFRYDILNTAPYEEWKIKEKIAFEATLVSAIKLFRHGRMSAGHFDVMYQEHILHITIYNRPWVNQLKDEQLITIQGIYMGNDKVTAMNYDTKPLEAHAHITPVYNTKEGIKQSLIHTCIQKVYEVMQNEIIDEVPENYIHDYKLLRKSEALRRIYFPKNQEETESAIRTLKYEEFLRFFTAMVLRKNAEGRGLYKTPKKVDHVQLKQMIHSLPFSLTKDQITAVADILKDMESTHPMYRLIQGDVGCGKTAVAAISLYASVLAGYQSALLAPTEILARQHYLTLTSLLKDTGLHIEVLYAGLSNEEKERIVHETEIGNTDILIGTHSILQDTVTFKNLGFVAADEQQRFGVDQRNALKNKGNNVDFLLMSATPIPRTLASAIFGDMDVSTIETLPEGRKEPITKLIQENSFRSVLDDVMQVLKEGHQLYVICAAVEENEDYKARDVYQTAEILTKLFHPYAVGVLHGQMKSDEKQFIMQQFNENKIQVLVSTTVVEVGMNVVNATGMIIYDAERFGLSQLHQLRGRIQRGTETGQCWLLTDSKEDMALERLNVLVKSNDGFEISSEDLRLRGPGDILGTRQSGMPDFILGNLITDTKMINVARKDAEYAVDHQDDPAYTILISSVIEQNRKKMEWKNDETGYY